MKAHLRSVLTKSYTISNFPGRSSSLRSSPRCRRIPLDRENQDERQPRRRRRPPEEAGSLPGSWAAAGGQVNPPLVAEIRQAVCHGCVCLEPLGPVGSDNVLSGRLNSQTQFVGHVVVIIRACDSSISHIWPVKIKALSPVAQCSFAARCRLISWFEKLMRMKRCFAEP